MEKIEVVLVACVGCRDGLTADGIPLDHVPAGYQAKERDGPTLRDTRISGLLCS